MTTQLKLAAALLERMAQQALETITVAQLCEDAHITRPAFYYHFQDIYDLIAWIFTHEDKLNLDKKMTWQEMFLATCRYCQKNKNFIEQTYHSAARQLLIDFLVFHILKFHRDKFNENNEQVAIFFTYGIIGVINEWINLRMSVPPQKMIGRLNEKINDYTRGGENNGSI